MKAIVQDKYGSPDDVLELREIDKPVVEDNGVLVRVHAASVHPDVWHLVRGWPYALRLTRAGLLKPKNSVPGTDVAGHVESVGKDVTQFQPGDEVFGESVRGHQWHNGGAYAEYVSVPEDALALKPANLTFEQAAAVIWKRETFKEKSSSPCEANLKEDSCSHSGCEDVTGG